ncbi:H-NS histone family protein [Paraburkholderia sp.]|uniref:H-NS histone family protein n=1 Tax=Paraburkholderia sp. TaxID=1926495 RepID=UPI00342BFE19
MSTYKELLEQKRALEEQIAQAESVERTAALEQVRQAVADFNFTADDIFGKRRSTSDRRTGPQAPKFRDPATGATWSGRGKRPRWLSDENLEQFRIAD